MLDVLSGRHFVRSRNGQPWTFCQDSISSSTDCGNFWQIVATFGNFWQLLADCGNFWQLFATFCRLWQVLADYGNFWQVLADCDNFWQLLVTFGRLWQVLVTFGRLWQVLASFVKFWQKILFGSFPASRIHHTYTKDADSHSQGPQSTPTGTGGEPV